MEAHRKQSWDGTGWGAELTQVPVLYVLSGATAAGPGTIRKAGPGTVVAAGPGRGHWRKYDVTDGLAGLDVRCLLQDREGYLWIGTHGSGLSRYDGQRFETITTREGLAGNRVSAIFQDQRENLEKVDKASDHLLAMINDLLDLSKIEAGRMDVNPERFDVRELVTSACDTVSPLIQDGVELRQDVADDIGEANTDKARLQQMVINLLSNAIKFTDTGSVTVRASRGQGAESGGEDLVIAVSDTGKGISADELPTIFDEYRQAEGSESSVQKGTGLGLSITKKFAELLGGSIGVESEVGRGSTFTVRVPMTYQEPRSSRDNA